MFIAKDNSIVNLNKVCAIEKIPNIYGLKFIFGNDCVLFEYDNVRDLNEAFENIIGILSDDTKAGSGLIRFDKVKMNGEKYEYTLKEEKKNETN